MTGLAGYVGNGRAMGGLCLCLGPALVLLVRHRDAATSVTSLLLWLWLVGSTAMADDPRSHAWAPSFDALGSLVFLTSATVCFACQPRQVTWATVACRVALGCSAASVLLHVAVAHVMGWTAMRVLFWLQAVGLSAFVALAVLGTSERPEAQPALPADGSNHKAVAAHYVSPPVARVRWRHGANPILRRDSLTEVPDNRFQRRKRQLQDR